MNDLISWLRQQLDIDERLARARLADHTQFGPTELDPEHLLRQVQAHRAILDEYVRVTQPGMKRPRYSGDAEEWFSGHDAGYLKALEFAIKTLVSIYSDRDGYDPAGRRDV